MLRCSKTTQQLIENFLDGETLSPEEIYQIEQHIDLRETPTTIREAFHCFSYGGTPEGIEEVYGVDIKEILKDYCFLEEVD